MNCVGCKRELDTSSMGFCAFCSEYERATDSSALKHPHTTTARTAWLMYNAAAQSSNPKLLATMPDGVAPSPVTAVMGMDGSITFDAGWGKCKLWPEDQVEVWG